MKNIPMFTTGNGVASLILEEIPYKKQAYIRSQTSTSPLQLLEETISFCRALGAEKILGTGDICLDKYPIYSQIIRMQCTRNLIEKSNLKLRVVTTETLQQWCDIYNLRMAEVPNAATMRGQNSKRLLTEGGCYFVYDGEQLVGIGKITGSNIDVIASLVHGRGRDILSALCDATAGEFVTVEVAVSNDPAIALYKRMGFVEIESISTWYCVFGE